MSKERSRRRNLSYNIRHRTYGPELVMYDFDAMWFNTKDEIMAYLETKFGGTEVDFNDREFRCLKKACLPNKPFFCLWYYTYSNGIRLESDDNQTKTADYAQYYIVGVNEEGKKFFPEVTSMTEYQMVVFEHELRGFTSAFAECMAKGFSQELRYQTEPPATKA